MLELLDSSLLSSEIKEPSTLLFLLLFSTICASPDAFFAPFFALLPVASAALAAAA